MGINFRRTKYVKNFAKFFYENSEDELCKLNRNELLIELEKMISLRNFSKMTEISSEYLSKIEYGLRYAPKDDIFEKIANKLALRDEEKEQLYDLATAAKPNLSLALDLIEYIKEIIPCYRVVGISNLIG